MRFNGARNLAAIGILSALVVPSSTVGCRKTDENWSEDNTRSCLQRMITQLELLRLQERSPMPKTFEEFRQTMKRMGEPFVDSDFKTDVWGTPYTLEIRKTSKLNMLEYILRSAGRDRQMNTKDDLVESVVLPVQPATQPTTSVEQGQSKP
jgi:hypothetical protein